MGEIGPKSDWLNDGKGVRVVGRPITQRVRGSARRAKEEEPRRAELKRHEAWKGVRRFVGDEVPERIL
jgi:hypothetical protein